jgi:hypothetical protein
MELESQDCIEGSWLWGCAMQCEGPSIEASLGEVLILTLRFALIPILFRRERGSRQLQESRHEVRSGHWSAEQIALQLIAAQQPQ